MKKITLLLFVFTFYTTFGQNNSSAPDFKSLILSAASNLKASDISEIKLSSQSYDGQNGITHYYFSQYFKGIKVYNAVLGLHLNKSNQVVAFNHTFISNLLNTEVSERIGITSANAIANAINVHSEPSLKIAAAAQIEKLGEHAFLYPQFAKDTITLAKVWLLVNGNLKLCYNVNWLTSDAQNWWNVRVDAETGKILDENNWVNHCAILPSLNQALHTDNLSDNPGEGLGNGGGEGKSTARYTVLPRPVESPSHGNMATLNDPSDSLASPFSWHDVNGVTGQDYSITRGNNVYAYEDKDNNNAAGYSPDGGSTLSFNFPFDKTKKHTDYLDAAITNLFYWNNLMHDVWYHYGFDDASGNFQMNNYSRGGAESDEVMAEAQDGSGTNNANFASPPDGQNPRMQMFVWNVGSSTLLLRVNQPSSIAKQYAGVMAGFGPKLTLNPINGNLVLVDDGSANPSLGCQDLVNTTDVNGQIALIDRGSCTFLEKVQFAQNAGAKAVIVINNAAAAPFTMGGNGGSGITIPSIMISQANGNLLKNTMAAQKVTVSLYDSSGATAKQYDSDFDNGIISHEYGHGISTRLTGGPDNSDCLTNQEQMGEGWSDFFALVMTHKPGAKGPDKRGIGTYAIDEPTTGDGIRDYPYSTDLNINPVTYNNIKTFSVPHGVGSVWCSMLWDMYWDLIDKYGYDSDIYNGKGGNNIAMKLVIDGMKLQPCNPGFTDARDAILKADEINNKNANRDLIWKAFARRGLGFSANQGSSNSRGDGTEAFDVPKFDVPVITKTARSEVASGDTIDYAIKLVNNNLNTLKNLVVKDTLPAGLQFVKTDGCIKGGVVNNIFTCNIDSMKSGDSIVYHILTKVTSPNFTEYAEITDFEGNNGGWKDSTLKGSGLWNYSTARKHLGNRSYFLPNAQISTDKVLMKTFSLNTPNPFLIFYHQYLSEDGWDGAVVEINRNGTWEDLGPLMVENGYNATISVNPQSSISGRNAFTGSSNGFIRTSINLTPYTNGVVKIRFRFASDGAQGAEGWYLDDIALANSFISVTNTAHINAGLSTSSSSASTVILKPVQPNGVINLHKSGISVSPNPFSDKIVLQSTNRDYDYEITDISGRVVLQASHVVADQVIETSQLSAGTYFLKVSSSTGIEIFKLVK